MSETTDDATEQRCTILRCTENLVLTLTSCVPLYRHDPPWPGAGRATYDHDDAVSDGWVVECLAGHVIWTSVDQIRAANAALPEDSGDWVSEDTDSAPTFRLDLAPFAAAAADDAGRP